MSERGLSGAGYFTIRQSELDRVRNELYSQRLIAGALRATIDAHGPITSGWIGSAAKRIAAAMRVRFNEETRSATRKQAEAPDARPQGECTRRVDETPGSQQAEVEEAPSPSQAEVERWKNNHAGQVATKRRLSKKYGELVQLQRQTEARAERAEDRARVLEADRDHLWWVALEQIARGTVRPSPKAVARFALNNRPPSDDHPDTEEG